MELLNNPKLYGSKSTLKKICNKNAVIIVIVKCSYYCLLIYYSILKNGDSNNCLILKFFRLSGLKSV